MTSQRVAIIEAKLTEAFAPAELLVMDQSHLHAGHEGAKGGGGHFHVMIVSDAFQGVRQIARHRMIFSALDSMMDSEIHALRIQAKTPDEASALRTS